MYICIMGARSLKALCWSFFGCIKARAVEGSWARVLNQACTQTSAAHDVLMGFVLVILRLYQGQSSRGVLGQGVKSSMYTNFSSTRCPDGLCAGHSSDVSRPEQ